MSDPTGLAASAPGGPAERLRRWRLVLGSTDPELPDPAGADLQVDQALGALYDTGGDDGESGSGDGGDEQGGTGAGPGGAAGGSGGSGGGGGRRSKGRDGLGGSAPRITRWLGDIRSLFPSKVVSVLQADAMDRLGLRQLLVEPELLDAVEPDLNLVATLMSLRDAIPDTAREAVRGVIAKVADDIHQRLALGAAQAVRGAASRADRTNRPRPADIDWDRTIRANLRHYQPDRRQLVVDRVVGATRRRRTAVRDLIICLDQSGSMAESVINAGVLASALAQIRSVTTRLVVFDTGVADLTDHLADPVDLLLGLQLGGGTDINRAVGYCQSLVTRPNDTVLVLITDLWEGGDEDELMTRVRQLVDSGVVVVVVLALADRGAPSHDKELGAELAAMGVPSFACSPDLFGELLAAAIDHRDLARWADHAGLDTGGRTRAD